jgi:deoxyadenosine/deoxycytidine kinase
MVCLITLEGNIGAGKSTLLQRLQVKLDATGNKKIKILKEPVDIWETIKRYDKNILELYYDDPAKYAFELQMLVFGTIYHSIQEQSKDCDVLICERSLESNIHIFGEMLFRDSLLSEVQMSIFHWLSNAFVVPVHHRVWLVTCSSECFTRIKHRGRKGEENISLDYLQKLERYHHHFFRSRPRFVRLLSDQQQEAWMDAVVRGVFGG